MPTESMPAESTPAESTPAPADEIDVPFLVVGAGPVGLTAARLLAQAGHRSLVVERRDGPQRHPAAHVVNARSLEIFRQAGFDMDAIGALAKDPADAGHVNFVTRLDGQLIGRLPFERQGDECLDHTPTPLRNISQHRLEPVLSRAMADDPLVDLRYRTEWRSSDQDAEGVTSLVAPLDGGEPIEVRSRYVLAADGAGSRVRKSLDIAMVGPAALQSYIAIHLAADLRALVAERPGVLHFVLDPAASGTFVAHDIDREWVFMVGFDPTEETVDDYDAARCAEIVQRAIGHEEPIEILDAGSWHMSAQVAERLRSDRIFLVGDAGHRFPPTGGLGLNTGVADAHNLVWKLDAVERGWADPALLDSYQVERHPVAGLNCDQSLRNAMKMVSLVEALGLTTSPTTERMLATLADPTNHDRIRAAVADQTTHFDMLGLQLGHVYAEGALARGDEAPTPLEDPSHFDPRAEVGGRLPHGWTADGRSTLDLIDPGRPTLLSVGDHERWAEAVEVASAEHGVAIAHVRIAEGPGDGVGADRRDRVDVDVEVEVEVEVGERWGQRCRLGPGGALLVRPDQHLAWRADTSSTNDTSDTNDSTAGATAGAGLGPALTAAVAEVLGR